MTRHRLFRSAALGLTLAAIAAPGAVARQDLRSPDTRDAAVGRSTLPAPKVTIVRVTEPAAPTAAPASGVDLGDAAIGAGFVVMLGLLGMTAYVALHRGTIRRSTTTRIA